MLSKTNYYQSKSFCSLHNGNKDLTSNILNAPCMLPMATNWLSGATDKTLYEA